MIACIDMVVSVQIHFVNSVAVFAALFAASVCEVFSLCRRGSLRCVLDVYLSNF